MWVFTASAGISPRLESSRLWNLGTTGVRAGQRREQLSRICRRRAPTRGRPVDDVVSSTGTAPGCSPRRRRCSTGRVGLSTDVHSVIHRVRPDGQPPGDRLCPQGCPHAVYEACPLVLVLAGCAGHVTPCYPRSPRRGTDRWGTIRGSGRRVTAVPGPETAQVAAGRDRSEPHERRLRSVTSGIGDLELVT